MDETKTIKEWRLERGLSREELAQMVGVEPERIARWEEVGLDFHLHSEEDELLGPRLFAALEPGPGSYPLIYRPSRPSPGDLVFARRTFSRVIGLLSKHGLLGELLEEGVHMGTSDQISVVVPTPYGDALVPLEDITSEDEDAIQEAKERDMRLFLENLEQRENLVARALEHGALLDETLGEADRRTGGFGTRTSPEQEE